MIPYHMLLRDRLQEINLFSNSFTIVLLVTKHLNFAQISGSVLPSGA